MMSDIANGRQLLRDPAVSPTSEVIAAGLGAAYEPYARFVKELEERQGITFMEWRFYNDGKAWLTKGEYKWTTARGANKVKPIFWLSIWEGFFKVTFFFAESVRNELQELPISNETKGMNQNITPNGKMMRFIPVIFDIESDRLLSDVYTIAEFRKVKIR